MKIKAFISIYAIALMAGSASYAAPTPLSAEVPSFVQCATPDCLSTTAIDTQATQQELAKVAKKASKSAAAAKAKKATKSAKVVAAKKSAKG